MRTHKKNGDEMAENTTKTKWTNLNDDNGIKNWNWKLHNDK